MAVVQSTYNETHAVAVAGMLHGAKHRVDTRTTEGAAGIGFGLACKKGTGDYNATLGIAANDFVGISVKDPTLIPRDEDKYTAGVPMAVVTDGDIWVTAEAAVADGDNVSANATTGALSTAGGANITVPGARWMTSAAAGGLAIVRLTGALGAAS